MSKITYPANGLFPITKSMIDECFHYLSNARSNADLDVPHRYSRRDYLKNLDNTIDSYKKQLDDIRHDIEMADRDFDNVCKRASNRIAKIDKPKINQRMIRVE